jgi:adenylate cyclase class 2
LTLKGPSRKSRSFKVREESETEVKKPRELARILKALGLKPSFSYRKDRTLFRKRRLTICLDETPAGAFIELEGERHEIVKFARHLGFTRKDFLTSSYVEILGEAVTPP